MGPAHDVNPRLAFAPCCYFKEITPEFAKNYRPLLDGVLFPYRDESAGGNLKNPDDFGAELKIVRERLCDMPILLDVYATAHSRLGATTPEYVEKVVADGLRLADGVQIYKHQDPEKNPEKYATIKRLFGQWATVVSERRP